MKLLMNYSLDTLMIHELIGIKNIIEDVFDIVQT